jgi:hypothetical protein
MAGMTADLSRIPDRHSMKTLLIDDVNAVADRDIEHDIWGSHSDCEVPGT